MISFAFYLNEQMVEIASDIVFKQMQNSSNTTLNGKANIEGMGEYFRTEALKLVDNFGMEVFTSALLYAIFIVQSLMFFWSYLKRFFYVLILALISPFVVVYDFLKKSIS